MDRHPRGGRVRQFEIFVTAPQPVGMRTASCPAAMGPIGPRFSRLGWATSSGGSCTRRLAIARSPETTVSRYPAGTAPATMDCRR